MDRHVQRRHRLIANDQLGVESQGAGNTDALALPAAEFMGIAPHMLRTEPDFFQDVGDPLLLRPALGNLMNFQRLSDDAGHGHAGVERGVRILENDLHLSPQDAHRLFAKLQNVLPLEKHLPIAGLDEA